MSACKAEEGVDGRPSMTAKQSGGLFWAPLRRAERVWRQYNAASRHSGEQTCRDLVAGVISTSNYMMSMYMLDEKRNVMPARVTIIRHAPTEYNRRSIFMGTKDIPADLIDERSICEAKKYIKDAAYSAVFTSPLKRAAETADKIIGGNYQIVKDDRLIERCLGDWEGLKKKEVQSRYPEAFSNGVMDFYFTPPNGEPYEKMVLRISEFLLETCIEKSNILLFTHNGVFRVMKSLLTGAKLSSVFEESEPFLAPKTFAISKRLLSTIAADPFYTIDS